jgi:catechol 2,3-dioxygenase-like lactoylglutathione lyase family enzyme
VIHGMAHVGVSVADLQRSIAFYRDVLGMEVVVEGPFSDERYGTIMDLGGATGKVALLKAGGALVELFEFSEPSPKPVERDRPVCDLGITHFCLEVTDIVATYERLKAAGVPFHCPPLEFSGIAVATYGRDPDGNVFELLQMIDLDGRDGAN